MICDRWYALTLGLPYLIDVHDCDARLPGPEKGTPQPVFDEMPPEEALELRSFQFMAEFEKLSVLLGKITKAIYRQVSPLAFCVTVLPPARLRLLFPLVV